MRHAVGVAFVERRHDVFFQQPIERRGIGRVDGVPRRWLATVKEAIRSVAPRFSARRMVKEYAERMYVPALLAEVKK